MIDDAQDVVKSRMQFAGELGTNKQRLGIAGWLVRLAKEEGFSALYRGLTAAYGLQFSVTATRFGTYALAKKLVPPEQRNDATNFILAGASGGTLRRRESAVRKLLTWSICVLQEWGRLQGIHSLR